jgi:hypothetical protein
MELNSTMFDTRFSVGTMLDVASRITGKLDKETKKPEFDTILVKYKINLANCTLKNVLEYFIDAATVKVANATRPLGKTVVEKLDGSVINLADLNEKKQVVKLTPPEQADAAVEKMNEEEIAALLVRIKAKMGKK